jgi:uncharacterized damage-inducible protein DinB
MSASALPPYLLDGLGLTPATLRAMVGRLPAARLDARLDPERFSPREALAHLADWEPIFRGRMEAAVDRDGVRVEVFDESARAVELRYATRDPEQSLTSFARERVATLALAGALSPESLARAYSHAERGRVTVRDTLAMMLGHDAYHLAQIAGYLPEATTGTW